MLKSFVNSGVCLTVGQFSNKFNSEISVEFNE